MSAAAVAVLAAGLVGLRDNAGEPVGDELAAATGLSPEVIGEALDGRVLPTLETTLALVEVWGGDVPAWREYWTQIAELAAAGQPAAEQPSAENGGEEQADEGTPDEGRADETKAAKGNAGEQSEQAHIPAPPPLAETPEAAAEPEAVVGQATAPKATGVANSGPIPPVKPAPLDPAAARRKRRRTTHRVFVAVVLLAAAGSGLAAYTLTRGDDTTGSARQQPSAHPVTSATPTAATATSVPVRPTPTPTTTPTTFQTPSDDEPTPTPSFPPTPTASQTTLPGTLLGLYPKIQLPSGYSVDFRNDTFHPILGTGLGGDTLGLTAAGTTPAATPTVTDSRFIAGQAVLFDSGEPGTFERCLNDTRYQQDVSLTALSVGSQFCVHGSSGELVLVKLDRLPQPQDANPYVMIDVTIWQGR